VPEGDTIWLTARHLRDALAGGELVRCDLRVPKLATVDLTGRTVAEVVPRGKHLLLRVDGGLTLHSHLRMDGQWRIYPVGQRWTGGPGHQIRAVLGTAASTAVGYRLPVLDLLRTEREPTVVGHLGPDLLGPDWDPAEAVRRLLTRPERPVGEALMDQRNLAGIGNVYKSELCYLRGVTPWTPVGQVDEPQRAVELAHRLLDANKDRHGHITTGDTRRGRTHWVYGREHQPCLRCGTLIRSAEQGPAGEERITYWCPRCQDGPAPVAV
jgi:formamidopyrimidine-DNA glycosylase